MPEYLSPGVYIEEVSFRSKAIEGTSTTTTAFIGPSRYGPVELAPELLTSLGDFKRVYGDGTQLKLGASALHNYLWHAVRAFFAEGGQRLYVSRVFRPDNSLADNATAGYKDGRARAAISGSPATAILDLTARWPGAAGNVRVRIGVSVGSNVLAFDHQSPSPGVFIDVPRVSTLSHHDVVLIRQPPSGSPPTVTGELHLAEIDPDTQVWHFKRGATDLLLTDFQSTGGQSIHVVKLSVAVLPGDGLGSVEVWDNLAPAADHTTNGANDALVYTFGAYSDNPDLGRPYPIVITTNPSTATGLDILDTLFAASPAVAATATQPARRSLHDEVVDPAGSDARRFVEVSLKGGNDGLRPTATEYEGSAAPGSMVKTGLKQFEDIDEISIVAAPGSTYGYETGYQNDANTIINLLIGHCQTMRYRIAVIDSGNSQTLNQVQEMRARFDSSWAAFYYPWVRVLDPVTRVPIHLPPSGFVSGIYARNDVTRAVYKAPANEVVTLALGFEVLLNKAQQDVLNPRGINCFRFFEGRGFRLWGGRTMSSDPEWKYVNLRRYFAYLEHSIERGTQWAVFEPNGPSLWSNVRQTIEDFLLNEFVSGALLGDKPDKAYFVRCDRSTMTQNDLDNGRLICLIGVSPVRPAEFVIFRIGQWTADRK